jgi:hypothetical protein
LIGRELRPFCCGFGLRPSESMAQRVGRNSGNRRDEEEGSQVIGKQEDSEDRVESFQRT